MLQLEFYKILLNNSPTYAKYKVEKAHILFVVPDKDGEVYDKVYEYNETDEAEIRALIKVVYEVVSSLKFLEDERLFVSPDESLGIKDIKNFIPHSQLSLLIVTFDRIRTCWGMRRKKLGMSLGFDLYEYFSIKASCFHSGTTQFLLAARTRSSFCITWL